MTIIKSRLEFLNVTRFLKLKMNDPFLRTVVPKSFMYNTLTFQIVNFVLNEFKMLLNNLTIVMNFLHVVKKKYITFYDPKNPYLKFLSHYIFYL
jgi:hypothetical protein